MIFDRTIVIGLLVLIVTGAVFLILRHPHVNSLFVQTIPDRPQRRLFLASVAFFLTFGGVRIVTYSNYHGVGPFHDIYFMVDTFITWSGEFSSCSWSGMDGSLKLVLEVCKRPLLLGGCSLCSTGLVPRSRSMSSRCGLTLRMSIGRVKAVQVLMP
jgi:hypothetical protein